MNSNFKIYFSRRRFTFNIDVSISENQKKSIPVQIKSPDFARKKLSNFVALD